MIMHANLLYAHTLKRTRARVHKLARNMTRTHKETQREKLETDALTPVGGHTRVHIQRGGTKGRHWELQQDNGERQVGVVGGFVRAAVGRR